MRQVMEREFNRATGLVIIEVINSNPNGDPDCGGDPRQWSDGRGVISPVSFKRKLRDLLDEGYFMDSPAGEPFAKDADRYQILEHRGRDRNKILKEMAPNGDASMYDEDAFSNSEFVHKYWDGRIFGNTFLEKGGNKGYIKTGVVQVGVGESISPVDIERMTFTNKAGVQEGKDAGMAPLAFSVVRHGVYMIPFSVNPNYAHKSGCTADDIKLFKAMIPYAYSWNRSAVRSRVVIRHAWYIEHKTCKDNLQSCQEEDLYAALMPRRIGDINEPSTSWRDYEDVTELPAELMEKVESCVDLMTLV